jgi:hypothetical protein
LEDFRPKKKTRSRRVNEGGFETNIRGFLSIPYTSRVDLPEDDKVFVQTYNAKIKHNESVKELSPPDGFGFHNKARRLGTTDIREGTKDSKVDCTKVLRRLILKTRHLFRVRRRSDSTWNSQKILKTRKNDLNSTGTHRL